MIFRTSASILFPRARMRDDRADLRLAFISTAPMGIALVGITASWLDEASPCPKGSTSYPDHLEDSQEGGRVTQV